MSSGSWMVVAGLIAIALGLFRSWRAADARAGLLAHEVERLSEARGELTARLSRESAKQKKQAEELAVRRKRDEKARKRQAKGAAEMPLGTAARVRDLEDQIERVERERDRSRAEHEALAAQLQTLEARAELAARALVEASAAKATADTEHDSSAPVSEPGESHEAQLAAARQRITQLEGELSDARETEARMRKRVANQEQLYASIRAELEVKKDRLRTQEEQIQRLEALQAAIAG